MSYFAQINKDNIVEQVISAPSQEWCEQNIGGKWLQTSYNTVGGVHFAGGTPLRKNYAGIGYTYDEQRDAFIAPKPYPSWILDEETCIWQSPVPRPTDNKLREWNEQAQDWVEITL